MDTEFLNDPLTWAAIYLLMLVIGGRWMTQWCMEDGPPAPHADPASRCMAVWYFFISPFLMVYMGFVFACVGIAIAIYYVILWPLYHYVIVPVSNVVMPELAKKPPPVPVEERWRPSIDDEIYIPTRPKKPKVRKL